jgi:hypothetical protein
MTNRPLARIRRKMIKTSRVGCILKVAGISGRLCSSIALKKHGEKVKG